MINILGTVGVVYHIQSAPLTRLKLMEFTLTINRAYFEKLFPSIGMRTKLEKVNQALEWPEINRLNAHISAPLLATLFSRSNNVRPIWKPPWTRSIPALSIGSGESDPWTQLCVSGGSTSYESHGRLTYWPTPLDMWPAWWLSIPWFHLKFLSGQVNEIRTD